MPVTTKSGRRLTDEDLERLADEVEQGFDLSTWRPRTGRPFLDAGSTEHSPRVTVRIPAPLRDRVVAKAAREGRTVSEVLRGLLETYAPDPAAVRGSRGHRS
jgi:hypothetical protein